MIPAPTSMRAALGVRMRVILALVCAVVLGTAATAFGGGIAQALSPSADVLLGEEDGDADLLTTRICGAPSAEFTNYTKDAKTYTGQKRVLVTAEFIGADVVEISLNGDRVLRVEHLEGTQQSYTVDLELAEGENVIRVLGSETCSTENGEIGAFAASETYIVYDPDIDDGDDGDGDDTLIPGDTDDADRSGLLAITGGLQLVTGLLIGALLSLLALRLMSRARAKPNA